MVKGLVILLYCTGNDMVIILELWYINGHDTSYFFRIVQRMFQVPKLEVLIPLQGNIHTKCSLICCSTSILVI